MSALRILFFLLVISVLVGISSCSIQKRHYRNGYYVQRDHNVKFTNTIPGNSDFNSVDSTVACYNQAADQNCDQTGSAQPIGETKNPEPGEIATHDTISDAAQESALKFIVTDCAPMSASKGERGENYSLIISLIALALTIVALTVLFVLGVPLFALIAGLIAMGLAIHALAEVKRYNRSHRDPETGKVIRMPVAAIVISILVLAIWAIGLLWFGYVLVIVLLYGF